MARQGTTRTKVNAPQKRPTTSLHHAGWWPLLFVGPLMLGTVVFYHYPIIKNFYTSFTASGPFGGNPEWVWFDNYITLFTRPDLLSALTNTFIYTGVVLLGIPLSVVIASMINLPGLKYSSFYRTLYFMPYIAMPIAIALVWKLVFNGQFGLINQALMLLGVENPPYWLTTPGFALAAVCVFGLWSSIGFNVIILAAGIKAIPAEIYEAAELDGAGSIRQFFQITVPLLSPSIFFLSIVQVIGGFQLFDGLFALMGGSNPALPQTRSLVYLFYNEAFVNNDKGAGAAVSVIILLLVGIVTLIQFAGQKKWVNYV